MNSRQINLILICVLFSVFFFGCTTKNFYNAVQENRLLECNKMLGVKKDECIAHYNKTFEEYTDAKENKVTPLKK